MDQQTTCDVEDTMRCVDEGVVWSFWECCLYSSIKATALVLLALALLFVFLAAAASAPLAPQKGRCHHETDKSSLLLSLCITSNLILGNKLDTFLHSKASKDVLFSWQLHYITMMSSHELGQTPLNAFHDVMMTSHVTSCMTSFNLFLVVDGVQDWIVAMQDHHVELVNLNVLEVTFRYFYLSMSSLFKSFPLS